MGKKNKNIDEPENFEVWILYAEKGWMQVEEGGNAIFQRKERALLLAQSKSNGKGVIETMVIARRPVATFNGEAIAFKHKQNAIEKKKENAHAEPEVHGGGPEARDAADAGTQLQSEAAPGGC